jgi:DNA ligase (NAD+)
MGPETVEDVYQAGYVRNVADLYTLKAEDLLRLERRAEKSAQNLIDSIEASKQVPYERVLFGLGIRYVGETVAKRLANAFPAMELLKEATPESLLEVNEIGERIAQSVKDYFADSRNRALVSRLASYGLQMSLGEEEIQSHSDKLKDLTFVISGTFTQYSRDVYKSMIEQNGGKNSGSVSGSTDYILAGENMGPAKLAKAEKLKVKIINEEEFLKLIE